jgi:hypothetical protein
MMLRFTAKGENIKPFAYLRHGQMSIKCNFVLNCLFLLIIQRVQCRYQSRHSMDSQAAKKEHLMKSGIIALKGSGFEAGLCYEREMPLSIPP